MTAATSFAPDNKLLDRDLTTFCEKSQNAANRIKEPLTVVLLRRIGGRYEMVMTLTGKLDHIILSNTGWVYHPYRTLFPR